MCQGLFEAMGEGAMAKISRIGRYYPPTTSSSSRRLKDLMDEAAAAAAGVHDAAYCREG